MADASWHGAPPWYNDIRLCRLAKSRNPLVVSVGGDSASIDEDLLCDVFDERAHLQVASSSSTPRASLARGVVAPPVGVSVEVTLTSGATSASLL
jgi:hypothetical protein